GNRAGDVLDPGTRFERHPALARLAAPGGDEDDAIGAARAVDRARGRVLQHVDRLGLARIDGHEGIALRIGRVRALLRREAIHDIERLAVRVDRAVTADPHARADARHARVVDHVHAGRLALEA